MMFKLIPAINDIGFAWMYSTEHGFADGPSAFSLALFGDSFLSGISWNGEYRSSIMPLYRHTITHSHTPTDSLSLITKGTQDNDISYSFSESLSGALILSLALSRSLLLLLALVSLSLALAISLSQSENRHERMDAELGEHRHKHECHVQHGAGSRNGRFESARPEH